MHRGWPLHLQTTRLALRPPTIDDAPALFAAYAADAEVTKYLVWKPHASIDVTRAFLHDRVLAWEEGRDLSWVLVHQGDAVGMVSARLEGHRVNFGYVLARAFWRRGLMPEGLGALVEHALALPTVYRAWAFCDVDNTASARVLEKIGMTREGVLRRFVVHPNLSNEPRDAFCYARVR